ncbi:hypothetical protein NQ317_014312 [Molorchus minor]|uniref:Uncharacterized protein n=1 Tax=Molorchus minor TaxID=1323400 RepID=A0ABQ9K0H4_9CUCU|nr:hypothetical protein NQ317_014312 [Molorchus minor]
MLKMLSLESVRWKFVIAPAIVFAIERERFKYVRETSLQLLINPGPIFGNICINTWYVQFSTAYPPRTPCQPGHIFWDFVDQDIRGATTVTLKIK